nr:nitroreductase family protein [candidate division Zixibacteria bacterium]
MTKLYKDSGIQIINQRRPGYVIDPIFINRWSPRAFDPEPLDDNIIRSLFEAARWSPSCYNEQPWLFCYATSPDDLRRYRSVLSEFNQIWTATAPVVGFILARRRFGKNNKSNHWAEFDCGAAWMAMTLQARMLGLYTHAMAGFDTEKASQTLNISPDDYRVIAAFAIGRYGDREKLDDDMKKSEQPNDRKPLTEIVIQGRMKDGGGS